MDVGSAIKLCREKRKMSQKDLAEKSGVSVSHLCLIEKSKREASLSTLESLADALNIPASIIILVATEKEELKESGIPIGKVSALAKKLIGAYLA